MAEEKKKESKSSKLYKDSPTAKRGEDGAVKVTRPSDEETESKIDQAKEPDGEGVEPDHIQAMKDMGARHEAELHDMHKRHVKELKKHYGAGKDKEGDEKKDEKKD